MDSDKISKLDAKSSRKKSKKEKKEKKHKKHKKIKKHSRKLKEASSSSSTDSDGSSNEWVEKDVSEEKAGNLPHQSSSMTTPVAPQRDEWMTAPCMFACVSRDQLRAAKQPTEKKKEAEAAKYMLDRPGQSGRELNPYWENNGTGLPSEKPASPESLSLNANTVGDQGVSWLRRALQRAQEQAAESGRSLEEIAAERWGSLQKLEDLLSEAEGRRVNLRQNKTEERRSDHRRDFKSGKGNERREYRENRDGRRDYEDQRRDGRYEKRDATYSQREIRNDRGDERYSRKISQTSREEHGSDRVRGINEEDKLRDSSRDGRKKISFSRPTDAPSIHENQPSVNKDRYTHSSSRGQKLGFKKPGEESDNRAAEYMHSHAAPRNRSWQKRDVVPKLQIPHTEEKPSSCKPSSSRRISKSPSSSSESDSDAPSPEIQLEPEVLSDQQMNELAAKLVKAEILGNDELIVQLKKKLEAARQARAANPKAVASTSNTKKSEKDVVILSRTDSKGFSRPLQTNSAHPEPVGGRRKKQKVDTHGSDGQRERYFPDDDKYTLQDMFQREKLTTVEDQNEMFTKLAGKDGRQEHDYDMDDIFSEKARQKESDGKIEARERGRAIIEHKRKERVLDNCKWCFDGKELQRHLIVAVGAKAYLCLPPYQSLTDGHCLIIPLHHTTCSTQLDEDVWEEIQDFRKALVRMFASDDEDCVLFESAMYLNKFPHMVLHCVPLPREMGDMAPIYFKKAILECETEWSTNKKLVDLSKKDIRHSVPKGLPYFAVDFGNEGGYAHVIEEEKSFPSNFAQEIVGGMLDLDHNIWRKPRTENFDKQRRKVIDFSKKWREFDFTKEANKTKRMKMTDKDSDSSE